MFFCSHHSMNVAPEVCGMLYGCPQDCQQRREAAIESLQRRRKSDDPRMDLLAELQRLYERRRDIPVEMERIQAEINEKIEQLSVLEGIYDN